MLQTSMHYGLHFLAPILLARLLWPEHWIKALLYMWATMLIDLDHLWATPVFDPRRCSIGFHPMHGPEAIAVYCTLVVLSRVHPITFGLVLHLFADSLDCIWIYTYA